MSSFTISKQEYIKCAGYVAGIAAGCSIGTREFWLYDYKAGKNTDKELFHKRFTQVFQMNAASVKDQYHGDEVGAASEDSNDYMADFNKYYKKGYTLHMESQDTKIRAIESIRQFFHSALYQTEDEKYNFMMTHWFFRIEDELFECLIGRSYECDNWGTFEAPQTSSNITRIA